MNSNSLRLTLGGLALCAGFLAPTAQAAVTLTGSPYSQDFDSLIFTGTNQPWTNDSTLAGWSLFNQASGGTPITTYSAGNGGSNTGAFYSFGTTDATERALGGTASGGAYFGSPASGAVAGWIAVAFTNGLSAAIDSFTVSYDGEQWRNGGNTNQQTMVLEYGFGATFGAVTTWTAPGTGFNFVSPIASSTAAALDGNAPANRTAGLGGTVSSLSWDPGDTLWIRWIENNDTGNDHGMGVDNFQLTYTLVPEPGAMALSAFGAAGLLALALRRRSA